MKCAGPVTGGLEEIAMTRNSIRLVALVFGVIMLVAASSFAETSLTLGSVRAMRGATVRIPVYAKVDASASQDAIQALSFKITYSPAAAVKSVKVQRAGILKPLTPLFESAPVHDNSASLIASFDRASAPLVFGSTADQRGDLVAEIEVVLADDAGDGRVQFALDRNVTSLGNQEGTLSLTPASGTLRLEDGGVEITRPDTNGPQVQKPE